ncbi:RNA-directed DNA polymerase, eukaryota [Tanacetum coccineum]
MGDFNEVRYKSDRYGSNFNAHDAEIFNSFIYNVGLDEVPLEGSAYTWCLKSASKSKLDRFFVSENLLSMCPNISDHRPILLREVRYDYGPIPFRFYRYWLEVDGFDKMVRDSWNVAPVNKKNVIRNFMGKLNFLKTVFGAGSLFIGRIRCNSPKLCRSGIRVRGVLLHRSTTQDKYRTTKKSFENDTLDLTK